MSGAIVVITGGAGFIGSRLAVSLAQAGARVRVVDLVAPPPDVAATCEAHLRDIADPRALDGIADGAAAVVHCAGRLSRLCDHDPDLAWTTNVEGTMHVLRACGRRGASRFVFLSTGGVYVDRAPSPVPETAPVAPRNLYTATKLAGEAMVAAAALHAGFAAAVVRLFTVYGPGPASGRRGHFLAGWLERIAAREPITVHGTGEQTVDATHVADVVAGLERVLVAPIAPRRCATYNLGSGQEISVGAIARLLRALEPSVEVRHEPIPPAILARQWADIRRAADELGYRPRIAPQVGIPALLAAQRDAPR